MDDMMDLIDRGDNDELQSFSQQYIPNHAFRNIDFGANSHGIYGATPIDVLHGLKLGIIKYLLEVFLEEDLNPAARHSLNEALNETLPHLKQGGDRNFPRLYFPNGVTSLKNITAEEFLGILFVTYLLCITTQGRNALSKSEKMEIARINMYVKLFERVLIFNSWLTHSASFWQLQDNRSINRFSKAIVTLINFITENCERKSSQGWNISKLHELLHVTRTIHMFGSPMNYDSGCCERMHKDVAKKPGRQSQKRHATFTLQSANRLADRHVIDRAYQQLVTLPDRNDVDTNLSSHNGSNFTLEIEVQENMPDKEKSYRARVVGKGVLASQNLRAALYPDLVQYIVCYFSTQYDIMPLSIRCCSEVSDDDGTIIRAHHDFRSTGFWHDWAWVSYEDDNAEDGFTNVPAKILCFLPDGVPGNDICHVVCHPCQWRKSNVSSLVRKWTLMACDKAITNGIPYNIVPVTALFGHCLVVPDLREPGVVYEVLNKEKWSEMF
jgi:hypothetical protein